jgi:hypothetical protein
MGVLLAAFLLGLAAAGLVTLFKGRYLIFAVGFLTFGLAWLPGGVALAEPHSWWARTFYGEDRLARAANPERFRRSRRTVVGWITATLVFVAVGAILLARPAALLGVDRQSLADSVGARSCTPVDSSDSWSCGVPVLRGDSSVRIQRFTVTPDAWGCWSATPAGSSNDGREVREREGCIRIWDW